MSALTIALILVNLLLAFFLFRLIMRIHGLVKRVDELESRMASQQISIHGLTAGAIGVDNRLRGIEDRESAIEHRQESIENLQSQNEAPFGEAIRLVQQGASAQRLVEELGISPSEASLIEMIHGGGH